MKKILFCILISLFCNAAFAVEYKEMKPNQFVEVAKKKEGDIKLVFLFTSWCSICKTSFNDLIALSDRFKGKKVSIIAVSLDENEDALKQYLSALDVKNFDVHIMKYSYISELQAAFARVGIGYTGAIPHTTLINQSGEIIADGNYKLSAFDQGLNILLRRDGSS